MKLKRALPVDRSYDQLKNHYQVEKSIAESLKCSDRDQRKLIYSTMYDELFDKVADHPRLTRRESDERTALANRSKFSVVGHYLDGSQTFLEFAPGDCRFVFEAANLVGRAFGVDISDQRRADDDVPDNFTHILYDGYDLSEIDSDSIDLVFSDQLIEHFHPEDTEHHFATVYRILKPDGKYVFRTPHYLTGPHDVSQYFSDEPECFHLKEWVYTEMRGLLLSLNYSGFECHWHARQYDFRMPYFYFALCEQVLGVFPKRFTRPIARYLLPTLCGVATK